MSRSCCARVICSAALLVVAVGAAVAGPPCDPHRPTVVLDIPPGVHGEFGQSLAVAPGFVAVGDPKFPPTVPGRGGGSVTVYHRSLSGWTIEDVITSPLSEPEGENHNIGGSIAIGEGRLLIGHADGVELYERDTSGPAPRWVHIRNLYPSNASWPDVRMDGERIAVTCYFRTEVLEPVAGHTGTWASVFEVLTGGFDSFGSNVLEIRGDLMVFGRRSQASIYRRTPAGWIADGGTPRPNLPNSILNYLSPTVATDGVRVAVGHQSAYRLAIPGWVDVYSQVTESAGWYHEARIDPPATMPYVSRSFGYSVAIMGDRLAIGAHRDDLAGDEAGIVYCYRRAADGWHAESSHQGTEVMGQSGYRVAIVGDDLVVTGSGLWSTVSPTVIPFCAEAGADKPCTPGIVGLLNFVEMYLTGDPGADYTADGSLSPEDLFRFLGDWFAGCPE